MPRLAAVTFVLLCAVATSGLGAGSATRVDASAGTALRVYSPFRNGRIAAGIEVARTVRSFCWTSSLTDPRSVAWRCFGAASDIHDPCFAEQKPQLRYVLCPLYTPESKVLRIDLTKPLPKPEPSSASVRRLPWAMHLHNGTWCVSRGGINGIAPIEGRDVSYLCPAGSLLGPARRSAPRWTILYADQSGVRRLAIDSAWW
jgi:hypothetical protein